MVLKILQKDIFSHKPFNTVAFQMARETHNFFVITVFFKTLAFLTIFQIWEL
jgi:hypothetical protein